MMKKFSFPIIFILGILFVSCEEYSSPVPAGSEKESYIDSTFLGCWDFVGIENETDSTIRTIDPHYLFITPFDKNHYVLQMLNKDTIKLTSLPNVYSATICKIGGEKMVSVRQLVTEYAAPEFLIYKYGMSNDTLWYCGFQKTKLTTVFNKTKMLKKYLNNYLNDTSVLLPKKLYVRASIL